MEYRTYIDCSCEARVDLIKIYGAVFKLAFYLAQPNHLAPVALVQTTLTELSDAVANGTGRVVIRPAPTGRAGRSG